MVGLKWRKLSRMNPGFLVWVIGWMAAIFAKKRERGKNRSVGADGLWCHSVIHSLIPQIFSECLVLFSGSGDWGRQCFCCMVGSKQLFKWVRILDIDGHRVGSSEWQRRKVKERGTLEVRDILLGGLTVKLKHMCSSACRYATMHL